MERVKRALDILPESMHHDLISAVRDQNKRQFEMSRKPLYWVGCTGNKYPYHNTNYNLHKGIDRYSNIGTDTVYNGEFVKALPKDEYPYTLEYSKSPYDS